jgi:hypothetical protein
MRVLRALLLLAVGILIVVGHQAFVELVAIIIGLYVAFAGASELMRLIIAPPAEVAEDMRRGRTALVAAGVGAVAILAAGAIFIGIGGASEKAAAIETEGCNGSEALCDTPLDDVAFPATHNAMSAATNPNWLFAQQEAAFPDQLHDGIRALLIDAHYGVELENGAVETDLSDLDRGERRTYEAELGPEALDAALRIRDRFVGSEPAGDGEPGVYLCHRFCELGAIPIEKGFKEMRDFLAANPDEVLIVVIEDYVSPEDIETAVKESGLIDYVYDGPLSPASTLGEMIESDGRAVIMAENDGGGGSIPWYHPVYKKLTQETPFSFKKPEALIGRATLDETCDPNRGPEDAPLFLINHWVDTSPAPKPSNAAKVNARKPLLRRIRDCQRLRGLDANLIAVDFYRQGDVFEVVEMLNTSP